MFQFEYFLQSQIKINFNVPVYIEKPDMFKDSTFVFLKRYMHENHNQAFFEIVRVQVNVLSKEIKQAELLSKQIYDFFRKTVFDMDIILGSESFNALRISVLNAPLFIDIVSNSFYLYAMNMEAMAS